MGYYMPEKITLDLLISIYHAVRQGKTIRPSQKGLFSIFQLPIMHSVCPPNLAYSIVVKFSREVYIFPREFHNDS